MKRVKIICGLLLCVAVLPLLCCCTPQTDSPAIGAYELIIAGVITDYSFACSRARDFHTFGIIQFDDAKYIIVTADMYDFRTRDNRPAWNNILIGESYKLYGLRQSGDNYPYSKFILEVAK